MITAGQTIGNYRILNKIGTGGMGAVYLAEHPLIGKRVALKVIHRELAGNRDVVSRFFQEARSVNKIGNEHIVEIHDFGVTPEGDHFFIMEYLEGRTLASILAREQAFDIMRALHVGAQIANALAAAHAAGIVHRDLKPDNIMLMKRMGDQDFVKVLDFGLAKVFSAATAVKTAAGVLLGTPQYMSPEACESKGDVDHRTDIYALGVLLFQMMTGVLPFDGESMGEVLVKQVTALPPVPRALNPAIPPSVEQILLRCLAKRVDARFATMMALREALLDPEAYLRGSPPIAAARSVGSGDPALGDARTMMVPAAALQQTRMAPGPQLPLPAPAPSMMGSSGYPALGHGRGTGQPPTGQGATMLAASGAYHQPARRAQSAMPGLSPPLEPKMNTMRIATPVGYTSRPPRKAWPIVLVASLLLGLGGGAFAVARFGHGSGHGSGSTASNEPGAGSDGAGAGESSGAAGSGAGESSDAAGSGASGPNGAGGSGSGGTAAVGMMSGSSAGTADATSGSGAGTTSGSSADATSGSGAGTTGTTSGSSAGILPAAGSGATAGSAARPSTDGGAAVAGAGTAAKLPTARLSIDSVPSGAAVAGPDGATLGKTPLKIEWPISDLPVTFELRLGGYRKKQRQTVVNSNTALHVELERLAVVHHPVTPKPNDDGDNALMRP